MVTAVLSGQVASVRDCCRVQVDVVTRKLHILSQACKLNNEKEEKREMLEHGPCFTDTETT